MIIALVFAIFVLFILSTYFLVTRIQYNNTIKNKSGDRLHYYMFTIDTVSQLIYVTSKEKKNIDELNSIKSDIIQQLNLENVTLDEIGVSYIGQYNEIEVKSKI